ncbi:HAD family hydrolase [Marinomonas piezotolerans]|uniref:HAD family hydrolase n=1 Tax=Marinomonas piezotolerans TaxID=2213058 RepID=A0A370UDS6_9GAMM|nr:HAD-IA family hydrolase [Marinomonas piezotolerans]RDL45901.1 HAD family hydrolase [Marinomonas piezotolerans]
MIKLVIFDWDGTLYNSIDRICDAMLQAGNSAGAATKTHDDVKNIIGLSLDIAVRTVWPEEPDDVIADIVEQYKTFYVASDQTPPQQYDGVAEFIDWLYAKEIGMAVATGKSRRGLDRVMALTNTKRLFLTSRCADETRSKPDPTMIQEILDELSVQPSEAIVVGDTEYDLDMAAQAGVRSIGVDYGAHEASRLKRHNPLAIVSNLVDLKNQLQW